MQLFFFLFSPQLVHVLSCIDTMNEGIFIISICNFTEITIDFCINICFLFKTVFYSLNKNRRPDTESTNENGNFPHFSKEKKGKIGMLIKQYSFLIHFFFLKKKQSPYKSQMYGTPYLPYEVISWEYGAF